MENRTLFDLCDNIPQGSSSSGVDGGTVRHTAATDEGGSGASCHSAISLQSKKKKALKIQKTNVSIELWPKGSKIKIIPNKTVREKNNDLLESKAPPTKRGNITALTWRSMSRLREFLAEVDRDAKAYTFCLTYPEAFPSAYTAKLHFKRLKIWINQNFRDKGMLWKREPQKRGATHFHLLAFLGDDEDKAREIAHDIMTRWCEITTGDYPLTEHKKQLQRHLYFNPEEAKLVKEGKWGNRPKQNNFSLMIGKSFYDYLGKYISKDSADMPEGYIDEGGGAWWNKINKNSIPMAEKRDFAYNLGFAYKAFMRFLYRVRDNKKQETYDKNTAFPFINPRVEAEKQEHRMLKKNPHLKQKAIRKMVRNLLFKLDGSRPRGKAPIKAKSNWHFGSVKFLGDPEPIVKMIQRYMEPKIDTAARSRIFSDDYQPQTN